MIRVRREGGVFLGSGLVRSVSVGDDAHLHSSRPSLVVVDSVPHCHGRGKAMLYTDLHDVAGLRSEVRGRRPHKI